MLRKNGPLGIVLVAIGAIMAISTEISLRSVSISVQAEFGFINYLSPIFFVGLAVLFVGIYFLYKSFSTLALLASIVIVALVIWGLPVFALEQPYHPDALWHMSVTNWVSDNGKIDLSLAQPYSPLVYLQWPTLFASTSVFQQFSLLDPTIVSLLFSLAVIIFFVVIFYALAFNFLRSQKKACLATMLAVFGNGAMFSIHYSPSALGEVLFPLMILVFFKTLASSDLRYWFLLGFLTFLSVVTHGPTSLLFLIVVCFVAIFPNRLMDHPENKRLLFGYSLFCASIFIFWQFFVSSWGLLNLNLFLGKITSLFGEQGTELEGTILSRQVAVFPLIGWIKRGIFGVFLVPVLFFVARDFFRKNVDKIELIFLVLVVTWLLGSLVTDISDRVLAWVVPFAVVIMVGKLSKLNVRRFFSKYSAELIVVGVFLISVSTLMTTYSGAAIYINSQAESSGFVYLASILKANDPVYGVSRDIMAYYLKGNLTVHNVDSIDDARVVVFDRNLYSNYYYYNGGNDTVYWSEVNACFGNSQLKVMYSNPDFLVFERVS
jgi:hypothetical protein